MKKFLAVVLSAALVAGLAAGCGSKEDGKEEDKGSSAKTAKVIDVDCLLYTSPSPRDLT